MNATALLADDEPLARLKLRELLAEVPWLSCVGEAGDGLECLRLVDELTPDVLFLDIQMPGLSGLEVLARARHAPTVIFTTAYDRYAVAAFELQALDYLLKPFGRPRFQIAIERLRRRLDDEPDGTPLLERARAAMAPGPFLARLFVRDRGRIVPVRVADIQRLEARDDYVAVHVAGGRHLVHMPMSELTRRLDPERFLQVHRSHIVNLDQVAALVPYDGSRLQVELKDGTKVMASRARSRQLRAEAV